MQRSWEVRQSKREQTAIWPYVACHLKIADREGNREREQIEEESEKEKKMRQREKREKEIRLKKIGIRTVVRNVRIYAVLTKILVQRW